MTKHSLLFVGIILLLLYSCDNSKEQELSLREADLNRRVQLFKAKEAEYFALLKMRDSLQYQDSIVKIIAWPEGISGLWNSRIDRKSTRLNSSHVRISYAVFCLKKKKNKQR